ncbi:MULTISPECIES: ABC transporter ATP-binding protein, partial [unclassified Oceanobacillus]|uniref:ABC transporter ATP-binding protein n=1 Tax=unclassified Oceanobacillus TaxID=2630292 RepID=UPI00300E2CBC
MKNKNTIFLTKHYLLQKNKIILFTVLSISISIFNLFIPLVVSEFVNTMLAEKIFNFTYSQLMYLSLIILLYLLFQFLKSYLDTNIIATSNKILRKKLISKLYRLDLNKNKNSYNINQIINSDVPIVQTFYNKVFINIIKDILTIIGIIIIILLFSIKLFIFFIIVSGVYYMMYRIIGNKIYNLNKEMIHQRDLLSNRIEFLNNNILSAKCFYENSSNDKSIKKRISLISKILNKNGLFSALSIVMNSSIYYIVIIVLFAYGGYEVSRGNLTIGAVFSIFLYLNMALNPTKNLSNLFVMLKSNMTNIERVREFFELIEEDTERNLSNKRLPEISNGKVLLKDCEVYLQNRFNSGLNFTFERGRLNKINGYNGIGKTRLLLSILKLNSSTNIF